MFCLLREARFSSAVIGGVGPNSKSIVNGTEISRPWDLVVSSGVLSSSVRPIGSESVPVGVEEEGSLGLPPKRPLILSINQSVRGSEWLNSIPRL